MNFKIWKSSIFRLPAACKNEWTPPRQLSSKLHIHLSPADIKGHQVREWSSRRGSGKADRTKTHHRKADNWALELKMDRRMWSIWRRGRKIRKKNSLAICLGDKNDYNIFQWLFYELKISIHFSIFYFRKKIEMRSEHIENVSDWANIQSSNGSVSLHMRPICASFVSLALIFRRILSPRCHAISLSPLSCLLWQKPLLFLNLDTQIP